MIRAIIASTIVLGLAGLLATLAHRASASVRHAIWFVGLTTALAVGVLAAVGPVIEVESTLVNGPAVVDFGSDFKETIQDAATDLRVAADVQRQTVPSARAGVRIPLDFVVLAAWLMGVVLIVGRAILGHVAVARLISRARDLDVDLRLDVDASIDVRL